MAETTHKGNDFSLSATRGDEIKLDLAVKRTVGGTESAQDLTGGVVYVTGKLKLEDPDSAAVFKLHSGEAGGVEIEDAEAGIAVATIVSAKTAGLPAYATVLRVDCVWVDPLGAEHTFQSGVLTIYPDVLRSPTA